MPRRVLLALAAAVALSAGAVQALPEEPAARVQRASSSAALDALTAAWTVRPAVAPPRRPAPKGVLLTFDDGPHPTWTPQVLALLRKWRVRAAFCVVGAEVRRHPTIVRAIARDGHVLCNHSTHHDLRLQHRPRDEVVRDLRATQIAIREATGGRTATRFRVPGGRWSPMVAAEARRLGLEPLTWTVDPRDWTDPGVQPVVRTVLRDARRGGVVLLHDGGSDRSQTLEALRLLLPRLRQRGLLPRSP